MQIVLPPPAGFIPLALPLAEHNATNAYATALSGVNHLLPGVKVALYMLYENISDHTMITGRRLFANEQSQIHFVNVSEWMTTYKPTHLETTDRTVFYRLAIPTLFARFPRIIYVDDDIFFKACPSLLYYSVPRTAQIGATRDLLLIPAQTSGFHIPEVIAGGAQLIDYHRGALGVLKSDDYFQDGILIFNTLTINSSQAEECGQLCNTLFWMNEQDILNRVFYSHVHFIHQNWNVCCGPGCAEASQLLPTSWKNIYDEGLVNPFAVHFTGSPKPWNGWNGPYAEQFRQLFDNVSKVAL
ncbi:hypothetical protein NQF87_03260 [Bombella sp. TMW 2.2559]|uniref:Glycosyl transferase n=1 Tax=Bombella dulcis TaxID=2967339 RepID=A0ABT3WCA3_9PROT|nr:glycosyltransferase [Bombella dulcis]MCX5615994.1 hypothetical protein [Bombella dulcis]